MERKNEVSNLFVVVHGTVCELVLSVIVQSMYVYSEKNLLIRQWFVLLLIVIELVWSYVYYSLNCVILVKIIWMTTLINRILCIHLEKCSFNCVHSGNHRNVRV